jgi:glucokinase
VTAGDTQASGATIGVDVGGTKLLAVLLDGAGATLDEARVESPLGLDRLVDAVVDTVGTLRATRAATAVGVGIAGMVDLDGSVVYSPNLPGLVQAPLRAELARALELPVEVDNDANVAALAETTVGAAADARDALLVTFGTGIGGGLVTGGRVMRGAHGFAGEIGHFTVAIDGPGCACGARGHWEAIASGSALGRMARELVRAGGGAGIVTAADGEEVTGLHVEAAARAGDRDALDLLARFADNVAIGLAGLCNILDPGVVVIAGGLVELGELLMEPLRRRFAVHLEGSAVRPEISLRPAALGERASAVGAALLAREAAARTS